MGAKFKQTEKDDFYIRMIECGFSLIKHGGIKAVNIDTVTKKCFVAKGTFYNLFTDKADFIYKIMTYKRQQSKQIIHTYLNRKGKLSKQGLADYLHYLANENPNIFSYLTAQETKWLVSKWPADYLENEENDETTAQRIISFLSKPKEIPDWKLFCNYLKLISWALNSKDYLIPDTADALIAQLIHAACNCVC